MTNEQGANQAPAGVSLKVQLGAALLVALGPLGWFGSWLERSTHHRPLGAVVFACVALVVCGGAWLLSRRLLASGNRALIVGCLALAGALTGYVLLRGALAGVSSGATSMESITPAGSNDVELSRVVTTAWTSRCASNARRPSPCA